MTDAHQAGRPSVQIGTLLSATFKVLLANFVPFVVLVSVVLSPVIVLTIQNTQRALTNPDPLPIRDILNGVLALILTQVASAALVYGVFQHLSGSPASIGDCIVKGLRKTPIAILTGVVYSLMVGLGVLLCIVPGVYLGVVYCVAVPVAVLEGKGFVAAMKRSKELTIGHGWTLLAAYIIVFVGLTLVNLSGLILLFAFPSVLGIWLATLQVLRAMVQATLIGVAYYQLRSTGEDLDLVTVAKVFE